MSCDKKNLTQVVITLYNINFYETRSVSVIKLAKDSLNNISFPCFIKVYIK